MDIQELVDARIREISESSYHAMRPAPSVLDDGYLPAGGVEPDAAGADPGIFRFGEMMDGALGEISNRVLAITEQVSSDYTRLEKDLLKSRLELLRSAELVLDLALSLKKQARLLMASVPPATGGAYEPRGRPARLKPAPVLRPERTGRASLYNEGVADLFRRT